MSLTESTFLTAGEVRELTDRVNMNSQVKVLRAMGIEHRMRPDGSVVILRSHVNKVFDGLAGSVNKNKTVSPNWGAI